jgi:glycosyltransferase involved in cell wall biosynthesis
MQERPSLWKRLKRLVSTLLTNTPDSHVFWIPFALVRGAWILLRNDIDVIYCSSPPHSSHAIAYLLAKCFRKPYVLDFRDPWYVAGSVQTPPSKHAWLLGLETRAKRAIVRGAARVICASRGERDEIRAEHPELDERRFTFITNGYDPGDFDAIAPAPRESEKLTLIHAGTLYSGIAAELFAALRKLVESHPQAAARIEVTLLGEIADEYLGEVRELEAAGILRYLGFQPHAKTLSMLLGSDVLVILLGGSRFRPSHLPAKTFEYLHVGKPILAIAPEGELTEIVKRSGLGLVLPPHSVEAITKALLELSEPGAAARLQRQVDAAYVASFERKALAARLAATLEEARVRS